MPSPEPSRVILEGEPFPPDATAFPADDPFPAGELFNGMSCGGGKHSGWGGNTIEADVDYLMWWVEGNRLPPLVTTSIPAPAVADIEQSGVLGFPATRVLHGDDSVDDNQRAGARLRLLIHSGGCCGDGLEFHWLSLGDGAETGDFGLASPGDPVLARPFFNVATGMQDSVVSAYPDVAAGRIAVDTSSELHSGGALWHKPLYCTPGRCGSRIDFLLGYRYARFQEKLTIFENSRVIGDPELIFAPGTTFSVFDRFEVENEFHGGEIGLAFEYDRGGWSLDITSKVALGNMRQHLTIDGGTTVVTPPPGATTVSSSGGLLALPTNIGAYSDNEFSVLPEVAVELRYWLTCRLNLNVGYNFLVISDAARTGDQVDFRVNPTQLPARGDGGALVGEARPGALLEDNNFWVQGLTFGAQYQW